MTPTAGLGFKPQHFEDALASPAPDLWFEVHPENYMVDGGPRLAMLDALARRRPLSLHGVGLSLAADADPDPRHLTRLRDLVSRCGPVLVSEHLAWSAWRGIYNPDLLPFPRTPAALDRVSRNVEIVQRALGRSILIENPSHYLPLEGHSIGELDFLRALCGRTGCGLLMDVNNVLVSANNLGFDAGDYIDDVPADLVGEIHLAGHGPDPTYGNALLIDTHAAPVAEAVWALFERLVARIGARPTLIERDDAIPAFDELLAERERAGRILRACETSREVAHV